MLNFKKITYRFRNEIVSNIEKPSEIQSTSIDKHGRYDSENHYRFDLGGHDHFSGWELLESLVNKRPKLTRHVN